MPNEEQPATPEQPGALETTGVDSTPSVRAQTRLLFAVSFADIKGLVMAAVDNWFTHNVPRLGASVAFYTLLSIAPLLIIVIAVAGAVFGRKAAQGQLVWQIQDLVGREGALAVQSLIEGAYNPGTGTIAAILGLLTLLYGATGVVNELRSALNTIWAVPQRDTKGWRSLVDMLRERTLALTMVLGFGFLLLVSLAVNAALSAIGDRFQGYLPTPEWVLQTFNFLLSYLVITGMFATLYKVLPDLHIEWRDVFLGASITALLFSLGKFLIGIYLGKASVASTYGAAGSLVILLLWVYYSAQIFFLGAEFTQAYAQQFGSKPVSRLGREVRIVTSFNEPPKKIEPENNEPLVRLTDL